MEYHNPTLRVLRILELIDANSGGLSLSEIANLLAFSSQSHFIQVFSKKVGVTPRQFRESEYRSTLMRGDAPKM